MKEMLCAHQKQRAEAVLSLDNSNVSMINNSSGSSVHSRMGFLCASRIDMLYSIVIGHLIWWHSGFILVAIQGTAVTNVFFPIDCKTTSFDDAS